MATVAEPPHGGTPPARCLDITRALRRLGRGAPTGVDRVERLYLARLLAGEVPVYGLARTSLGYLILDRMGLETLQHWAENGPDLLRRDRLALLRRSADPLVRRAEAALSTLATARSTRLGLPRLLRRSLPPGTAYLNVGHSNLDTRCLTAWGTVPGARRFVLIHDTIPLDFPDSQRPGMVASFRKRLAAVSAGADLVGYVSGAARKDAERHLQAMGRVPPGLVARNGVEVAAPDVAAVPPGLIPDTPYFVILGTIEPRKNHALLLDIWDGFAAEGATAPHLLILGRRGWNNDAVFRRLDALKAAPAPLVHEAAGLTDAAVSAILKGARALLMPSLAEGFGLPVGEAAALGVPVVAGDLPVYREVAQDWPVYLPLDDRTAWASKISEMSGNPASTSQQQATLPSWDDHFRLVFSVT